MEYSPVYLERFFRNLLLGEQWDLRNRYLHIHPSKECTPYAIFYKGNGLILTENDFIKYGLGKQIIPAYAQKTQFVVLPIPIGDGAVFTTTNPICTTYNDFTVDKR